MRSLKTRLHELSNHFRNLLECAEVSLLLGYAESGLRHPLFNLVSPTGDCYIVCSGSLTPKALLYDERVRALCDMAMQTGLVWCIDHFAMQEEKKERVVAVPLERPSGILGLLLFLDTRLDAFQYGEWLLIEQYLPIFAHHVEMILCDIYTTSTSENCERAIITDMQEQSEFVSMVSHELRVPLTAIKGYAGLLQAYGITAQRDSAVTTEMTPIRQQQYLNVIMEQANHLEVLISDLLDISRVQAGRLALRRMRVNLAQQCQRVAQLVQYCVDEQQAQHYCIRCSIDPELPLVWADPDRVQQVLTNLVENAVKYSPNGGLIEIQAYTSNRSNILSPPTEEKYDPFQDPLEVYVTVRDQGIGIPDQQQSSLFRPFTRLEHPAAGQVAGAGLGLYISRKLVEAMKGRVLLYSCEGKGTSVTFTLPVESLGEAPSVQIACR